MCLTYPQQSQALRYPREAALQTRRKQMHECLQIIHIREKCVEQLLKVVLARWQQIICQSFHDVPEVLTAVEADPVHAIVKDQSRRDDLFRKIEGIYTPTLELIEINAAIFEHLYGCHGLLLCVKVEIEIELPCRDRLRELSVFV